MHSSLSMFHCTRERWQKMYTSKAYTFSMLFELCMLLHMKKHILGWFGCISFQLNNLNMKGHHVLVSLNHKRLLLWWNVWRTKIVFIWWMKIQPSIMRDQSFWTPAVLVKIMEGWGREGENFKTETLVDNLGKTT